MALYHEDIATPIGPLRVVADDDGAVVSLSFETAPEPADSVSEPARTADISRQIHDFFARKGTSFDLILRPAGTAFQHKVWQALCSIPFGETISYQELARRVGDVKASQAVGQANNRNPIPVIIPCHRVIGKNGALVGFGGGLDMKRRLLEFESPLRFQDQFSLDLFGHKLE